MDCLKLENQLCFPLYVCSKEVIKKYKPYLDEFDLTYTQYIALMVLWEEHEINVKSLKKRKRSDSDERNLIISITKKGENLKNKLKDIPSKVGSCINLDEREALELYKLLYKILNNNF